MAATAPFPDIPLDIMRLIFEAVIEEDCYYALDLMLLARRVWNWVEPLLYRVVIISSNRRAQKFLRTITMYPDTLGIRVRKILICSGVAVNTARTIFSALPNLQSLAVWICGPFFSADTLTKAPSLRRLSISLHSDNMTSKVDATAISSLPNSLTHLELNSALNPAQFQSVFQHLPQLTHLMAHLVDERIHPYVDSVARHIPGHLQQLLISPLDFSLYEHLTLSWFMGDWDPRIIIIALPEYLGLAPDEVHPYILVEPTATDKLINWDHNPAGHPDIWDRAAELREELTLKRREMDSARVSGG
ncbi:hypothetical protein C8J56DRAFT_1051420 [Mycena floridula]|nr:hypothetical protein C8J56DRAFT_1051420 [Mycena floridula]